MHEVKFYDNHTELVELVAQYAAEGLEHGDGVVLVVTAAHRQEIERSLARRGVDVDAARVAGTLLSADAAEALAGVLVAGTLDTDLFSKEMGALLDAAGSISGHVRAYGEMAPRLCAVGEASGARDIEAMCDDLLSSRDVSLLCGYPTSLLDSLSLTDVDGVCRSHERVVAPSGYHAATPVSGPPRHLPTWKVLVPVPEAVGASRAFVADVLGRWGEAPEQVEDVVLLASEMATNAVIHARSPFRISVDRSGDGINVAVQDVAHRLPQVGTGDARSDTGRGMGIVAALSSCWGCDDVPSGKVVWAELAAPTRHAT